MLPLHRGSRYSDNTLKSKYFTKSFQLYKIIQIILGFESVYWQKEGYHTFFMTQAKLFEQFCAKGLLVHNEVISIVPFA